MKFSVTLIQEAEDDLFDIYGYILNNDSPAHAEHVLLKLQEACVSLDEMPERGHIPPELERIGITEFKEIHFKPYRIIYEIEKRLVLSTAFWTAGEMFKTFWKEGSCAK